METNKQLTGVEWQHIELSKFLSGKSEFTDAHDILIKAKERERERMIELIQFIVSEKELVDYSSVSKETANYYYDKFNRGGK